MAPEINFDQVYGYTPVSHDIRRPILNVWLFKVDGSRLFRVPMILDSGADTTAAPSFLLGCLALTQTR